MPKSTHEKKPAEASATAVSVLKFGATTFRVKAGDSRAVGGYAVSASFSKPEEAVELAEEWKAAGHYTLIRIEASRAAMCFPEEG